MTFEAWLVLGILAVAIVLFVTELLRVDVVAVGVVVTLILAGILTPGEAISGFSNSAVVVIAALFVIGGAISQTGLAGMIGRRVLLIAGTDERRLTIVLFLAVAFLSSFMSNTGTVAVLLPAVVILARTANLSPSKLLIPMAYGSLVGGATTLIGTPPNLIVSEVLLDAGYEPFTFFSFTLAGLVLVFVGIVYMMLIGRHLLPDRETAVPGAVSMPEPKEEIVDRYQLPDNIFRLRVRLWSRLIGKSLAEAHFGDKYNITVLEILRREEPRPALRLVRPKINENQEIKRRSIAPEAESVLEADDILIVQGDAHDVGRVAAAWAMGVQATTEANVTEEAVSRINDEVGVAEILIPNRSHMIGKTVVETRFGSKYNLTVLGILTPGNKGEVNVRDHKLEFGDTLLAQGRWEDIIAMRDERRDFVVLGQPESTLRNPNRSKAMVALGVLSVMILMMITGWLPLVAVALAASLAMVLTKCMTMDDAYNAIDWKSLILIAGMIPMSIALEKVGLIDLAANGLSNFFGPYGPVAVMGGLFLLTSLFTQFISNTATTVVIAPVALTAAASVDVEPYAFLMSVAIAASMAFATPVASPSNTLVMGAGNYRFGDYIKVGTPLILFTLLTTLIIVPILFPF
jgi:di/tricarboxylate transporter